MNRCPITYLDCGSERYSKEGLRKLSPRLKQLNDFAFTPQEQIILAAQLAAKMSIQGIQPKLSVILNVAKEGFEIVEVGGTLIFKPPHAVYPELPQNEDVTMKLAELVGIEVPTHGLVYNIDGSLTYFIKRFDRLSKKAKLRTEDFSQLLGYTRERKYESSMEKVVSVIEKHCTFPVLDKIRLFKLVIFNFLIGNEDMHVKNFSLIEKDGIVTLSPAYDLLNTTIVLNAKEEIALPIRGKKSNLNHDDFEYFAYERLGLKNTVVKKELFAFEQATQRWYETIDRSFLSEPLKKKFKDLIQARMKRVKQIS